jgi:hypothetical protein
VFEEMNAEYELHAPEMARMDGPKDELQFEEWVQRYATRIGDTRLFRDVTARQYPWSQKYTSEEYLGLLDTYSDHRSLPKEKKSRLYEGISVVIARHGGTVAKDYVAVLFLARKDGLTNEMA